MRADRFNEGKPQWHQLHFKSLLPLVRVMEYGEKKYGKDNWKKGQDIPSLCDCAMRHLTAFMDGEELDPESGVSHIGHIMANCMMIVYNMDKNSNSFTGTLTEDYCMKNPKEAFDKWLKETYNIEK